MVLEIHIHTCNQAFLKAQGLDDCFMYIKPIIKQFGLMAQIELEKSSTTGKWTEVQRVNFCPNCGCKLVNI